MMGPVRAGSSGAPGLSNDTEYTRDGGGPGPSRERTRIDMKECEWCGDDFRGDGIVLGTHHFCSDNCREEFRKDVGYEEAPAGTAERPDESDT